MDSRSPNTRTLSLRMVESLDDVDRAAWDHIANPAGAAFNPFVCWDFLQALEEAGCVSPRSGWGVRHLLAEDETGALVGAVPLYLKSHSQGEYVFDYGWADAFERAGGQYYPKLLSAVPFTPVTGPRLLAADTAIRDALMGGMVEVAGELGVSSLHVTFPPEDEWESAGRSGLLRRQDQQFHWDNRGYQSFEDFLDQLASRKRKNLRKERAAANEGVEIVRVPGEELTKEHWDAFFAFYMDTGARKWGTPYLNRKFFDILHQRMAANIVMVLVRCGRRVDRRRFEHGRV